MTVILGNFKSAVTLLRVCGLTFSALRQPVTSSSIFVTSLALKSHLSSLHKSQFFFLGYVIDSVKTAFLMPLDKKITFASLRERLLSRKTVSLKSQQKFVGKINSFTLVVLVARLYSGVSYLVMPKASKSYSRFSRLKGGVQAPALSRLLVRVFTIER